MPTGTARWCPRAPAARTFADDGLRDFALKSLERVLLACYKPGRAWLTTSLVNLQAGGALLRRLSRPSRSDGGPVRGLLATNRDGARALDAFDTTGNVVYEMMAEELGQYAVRVMWDEDGGGFADRAWTTRPPTSRGRSVDAGAAAAVCPQL